MYQQSGKLGLLSDSDGLKSITKAVISWLNVISYDLTKLVSYVIRYS
jgi:hypothetical protein